MYFADEEVVHICGGARYRVLNPIDHSCANANTRNGEMCTLGPSGCLYYCSAIVTGKYINQAASICAISFFDSSSPTLLRICNNTVRVNRV